MEHKWEDAVDWAFGCGARVWGTGVGHRCGGTGVGHWCGARVWGTGVVAEPSRQQKRGLHHVLTTPPKPLPVTGSTTEAAGS